MLRHRCDRCLPGGSPCDCAVRPGPPALRRRVQLRPDELDQAEFPVDDVPRRLGAEARQERILAIRLPRACFDPLLRATAQSTFDPARFASQAAWKDAIERSDVRLQWDPDSVAAGAARAGPRAASQRGAEHRAGQPALSSAAAPHAPGARCKRCRHGIMHTAHDTRRA
ncbi:hypothetical protein CEK63_11105 [Xanthomonas sontii]|nr:hypothetical protein CEK63_11105 [Xanthomonas sontii]